MKILLAAITSSAELSGVQRHAFNVVRCLLAREEVTEIHLAVAPWQQRLVRDSGVAASPRVHVHVVPMKRGILGRNLWFYREFPKLSGKLGVDVAHAAYPVPIRGKAFPCPVVVTLHDLYPFEIPKNFGMLKGWFNRKILSQCLENVDSITCVSDTTAHMLRRFVRKEVWQKASRIYNNVEVDNEACSSGLAELSTATPFLLCVAQHRRNKNIQLLLRVFERLHSGQKMHAEMRLAIVGVAGPETPSIRDLIRDLHLEDRVLLLEGIPEADLQWCYRNCGALILPSSTEGFGLPVIEALLAGCRVVCSDIPVLRELAEGHCRFVPLTGDVETAFAEAIATELQTPARRPIVLPQFSTQSIAEEYVAWYRALGALEDARAFPANRSTELAVSERSPL